MLVGAACQPLCPLEARRSRKIREGSCSLHSLQSIVEVPMRMAAGHSNIKVASPRHRVGVGVARVAVDASLTSAVPLLHSASRISRMSMARHIKAQAETYASALTQAYTKSKASRCSCQVQAHSLHLGLVPFQKFPFTLNFFLLLWTLASEGNGKEARRRRRVARRSTLNSVGTL